MKLFYCIFLFCFAYFVIADDVEFDVPAQDLNSTEYQKRPYCYRFTWLGPKFNNESEFKNATCEDILFGATNVPCSHPLVVSDNSNTPNTTWIWDNYKFTPSSVACRLVRGEVCAKFSYMYNGAYENITYMCTKANVENEGAIDGGCYSEERNGREVQVCFCKSRAGHYPCNLSNKITSYNLPLFLITIFFSIMIFFSNK